MFRGVPVFLEVPHAKFVKCNVKELLKDPSLSQTTSTYLDLVHVQASLWQICKYFMKCSILTDKITIDLMAKNIYIFRKKATSSALRTTISRKPILKNNIVPHTMG